MENIPRYGLFKESWATRKGEIRRAWQNKEWRWLLGYFVYSAIILTTIFFIVIGSVVSGLTAFGILKDNIFEPKRQLLYEIDGESVKNAAGQYVTIFTLTLHYQRAYL